MCGLFSGSLAAADGGWAGAPWHLPSDARAAAFAGINLFPHTSTEAYVFNPAVMAGRQAPQLSLGSGRLSLGRYLYAGHGQIALPPTAFMGVGFLAAGTEDLVARDRRGYAAGQINDQEQVVVVAFANSFTPGVSVGLNLHLVRRALISRAADLDLSATGAGLNVGLYINRPRFQLSLAVLNINTAYHWQTQSYFEKGSSYNEPFPLRGALGLALERRRWGLFTQGEYSQTETGNWRLAGFIRPLEGIEFQGGMAVLEGAWFWSGGFSLQRRYRAFRWELSLGIQTGVPGEGLRQYLTVVVSHI